MKILKYLSACFAVSMLFTNTDANAQQKGVSSAERRKMHREQQEDAYMPNTFRNSKTAPGYRFHGQGQRSAATSTIFTTQVNVNSSGFNIIGDAANEPSIAVNPVNKNEISIGWRQFDNVASNFRQAGWSFTTDAGQTWTFPGVIEPGLFRSDPVLDYDTAGNFYYNSLTNTPDYYCKVFKSNNGGATWDTGTDAGGGDKQWMTIDRTNGVGSGNIYASWNVAFTTCAPGFFTRSTNMSSSYEPCTQVSGDPYWATLAVGNAGELYIAGGGDNDSLVVSKSLNAQIPASVIIWNPAVKVFMDGYLNGWVNVNPSGLLGQVNVDVDRSNGPGQDNVYVVASVTRLSNNDPGDVMFVKSTDGGLTFSAPVKINDDNSVFNTQWFGTMSVAPDGRIDVVWLDTRDDISGLDSSALYYSYSVNQGATWSVNEKLSPLFDPHVGYPNQQKLGDYFDMISDSAGAHLAWANTLNGEQDVYYSYIMPPNTTSLPSASHSGSWTIFPNPVFSEMVIAGNDGNSQIEIYNSLGELVLQTEIGQPRTSINMDAFKQGIYMVRVINNERTSLTKKIIKH